MATLYLTEQHSYVHKDHDTLLVRRADRSTEIIPLLKIDQVVVLGDVTLSAAALSTLLERDIEIAFCTAWGKFRGRVVGDWTKHGPLRLAQHEAHADPRRSLEIARALVQGKLANMRTVLLRAHRRRPDPAVLEATRALKQAMESAPAASSLDELRGIEGAGTAAYFGAFGCLLLDGWQFPGRVKRPPRDPVNALLSFGYTLLMNGVYTAVTVAGLDPYIGFLHSTQHGKPALALDLMEEFRPLVVDSIVVAMLNRRVFGAGDFTDGEEGVRMADEARRRYLVAVEQRLEAELEHPTLGQRATYRRCIEIQTRLLVRWLTGDEPRYVPLTVR